MNLPTIKLHVIWAKQAHRAVIFRRGPSKLFATIGWNLQDDSFQMGQWLKGVIDVHASALSPDGKFLLYEAATFRDPDYMKNCFTAISYAPYLHALDFYFHNTMEDFGGFFMDGKNVYFPISKTGKRYPENRHLTNLKLCTQTNWKPSGQWQKYGFYFIHSLLTSGWKEHYDHNRTVSWQKELPQGLFLKKYLVWQSECRPDAANCLMDTNGNVLAGGNEWQWSDYDDVRKRIIYSSGAKLFSLSLERLSEPSLLNDFSEMKYAPVKAPYEKPYPTDSNSKQ